MSTIKEWLDGLEYDWEGGTLLVWPIKGDEDYEPAPGWALEDEIGPPEIATVGHPLVVKEFSPDYGSPRCPRFFARDEQAVYFPSQYDGSTCANRVPIDPQTYIDGHESPYPGG